MLTQTQLRTVSASQSPIHLAHRSVPVRSSFGAMERRGSQMTVGPHEEIVGENEPAEFVYKVTRGAVRTYKILRDGRRQIGGFYLPGDIFGLEIGEEHQFFADAISHTTVAGIRGEAFVWLANGDCEAARQLGRFE